jgi:hypothetical protein
VAILKSPSPVRIVPKDICPNAAGIAVRGLFPVREKIAQAYLDGALSKYSDRFVALSGTTSKLGNLVYDTCVTGIWTRFIERQLTWHHQFSPCPKPDVQVAPTWSWLSSCGSLHLNYGGATYMILFIKVLNKHDLVSRCNTSGELDDGRMRVQGLLYPVQSSQRISRSSDIAWRFMCPCGSILLKK